MTGEHSNTGGSIVYERPQSDRTVRYDRDEHERPSEAIINAVARATGVEASAISPTLYERADPDALDALFADRPGGASRAEGSVTMPFAGFEVTMQASGEIIIRH